ncbi:MAG: hypothetical protein K6U09_04165 [Acidobacteriia bacterium]|jgi:hypothetical protein|nr:hypothetical protein [Terriglobia bacterium]
MHRTGKIIFVVTLLALIPCAQGAYGVPQRDRPKYDPSTETTIEGVVTEKISVPWGSSDCWGGEHLIVKTDAETIEVHVGPTWFLAREGFLVEIGERVSVTGSRIRVNGRDVLITQTLRKGGRELKVRNERGQPNWKGKPTRGR